MHSTAEGPGAWRDKDVKLVCVCARVSVSLKKEHETEEYQNAVAMAL